jgi:hypothetical protein
MINSMIKRWNGGGSLPRSSGGCLERSSGGYLSGISTPGKFFVMDNRVVSVCAKTQTEQKRKNMRIGIRIITPRFSKKILAAFQRSGFQSVIRGGKR